MSATSATSATSAMSAMSAMSGRATSAVFVDARRVSIADPLDEGLAMPDTFSRAAAGPPPLTADLVLSRAAFRLEEFNDKPHHMLPFQLLLAWNRAARRF
jgi:hypothetical protein